MPVGDSTASLDAARVCGVGCPICPTPAILRTHPRWMFGKQVEFLRCPATVSALGDRETAPGHWSRGSGKVRTIPRDRVARGARRPVQRPTPAEGAGGATRLPDLPKSPGSASPRHP